MAPHLEQGTKPAGSQRSSELSISGDALSNMVTAGSSLRIPGLMSTLPQALSHLHVPL